MKQPSLRTARGVAQLCARIAWEKKAEDILVLRIGVLDNAPAEYFVLATCSTDTHIRAVAEAIEEATSRRGIPTPRREGLEALQWVLLDYIDVVVHLFRPETRAYYRLERLWGDVPQLRLSERTRRLYTVVGPSIPAQPDASGGIP
jgi:ribosome-associated protein